MTLKACKKDGLVFMTKTGTATIARRVQPGMGAAPVAAVSTTGGKKGTLTGALPQNDSFQFESGKEALAWSCEVLRRRRLPKLSALWREMLPESNENQHVEVWEADVLAPRPASRGNFLPRGAQERYDLALTVAKILARMGAAGTLLQEQAWGDWGDEVRLRAALARQEQLRRIGQRVRLNYRYTFRQLGELHGVDVKTVWRRVQAGLAELETRLGEKGLLG